MSDVADYLWVRYFKKIDKPGYEPDKAIVEKNVEEFRKHNRLVIIRKVSGQIRGVAVFLSLSDETYSKLESLDLTTEDCVRALACEYGENAHFIIVCGGGYGTLRAGIKEIKQRGDIKTVSWWNPDMTKLHRFKIKE